MNPKFKGLEVPLAHPNGGLEGKNGKRFSWKKLMLANFWSIFMLRKPWWNMNKNGLKHQKHFPTYSIQLQIDKVLLSSPLSRTPGKPGCCVLQLPSCRSFHTRNLEVATCVKICAHPDRIRWRLFRWSSLGKLAPWYFDAGTTWTQTWFLLLFFLSHRGPFFYINGSCYTVSWWTSRDGFWLEFVADRGFRPKENLMRLFFRALRSFMKVGGLVKVRKGCGEGGGSLMKW